jgi:hypothetical protein
LKKNSFILIISIIFILAASYLIVVPMTKQDALKEKQEALAKSLGVKIQDYAGTFPTNYFYAVLKPKMTLDEVHGIVRGYERVSNCWGTAELYYYFGTDKNDAIRFMLHYDEQGYFVRLEGEEPDSRTLGVSSGCPDGLLEK